ncbi:MAG: hypothetical protein PHY55_03845, partial [Bacteroidales bacterium]|nr:hypothetical protein [Bacteroidales bacterium]
LEWKNVAAYKGKKSPEEFLNSVQLKSFETLKRWESTEEYATLVALMLKGRAGNDLLQVYEKVSEKAKTGEKSAVDTFLKLQKEIDELAKRPIVTRDERIAKSKVTTKEEDDKNDFILT